MGADMRISCDLMRILLSEQGISQVESMNTSVVGPLTRLLLHLPLYAHNLLSFLSNPIILCVPTSHLPSLREVDMEVPREFFLSRKHDLIRYIGCIQTEDQMWFMTFMKGKKELIIQFKKSDNRTSCFFDTLEEIQNHSHVLDWSMDAPNWVYMNRRKDKSKSLRFMQKKREKDFSDLKEQCFARMIPEIEIDYDEVGKFGFGFGRWEGQEVDVYRVTMDQDFRFLNRAMKAYRRIQDMNLSYDFLGHVLDENGHVVGIMTEAMEGRRVTYRDYDIVMKAFERLIKIGYILDYPHLGSMLITAAGEVRFVEMHNVIELEKDPEARKWRVEDRRKMLNDSFEAMRQCDPNSCLPITRGKVGSPVRILVPHSDPARLLKGTSGWMASRARFLLFDEKLRLKLVRSGGMKRLLDEDSDVEEKESSDDDCDGENRQAKRLRVTAEPPNAICCSERPLPRLPVARVDLPVLPPSPSGGSSIMLSKSPTRSVNTGISSWLFEGPWLALAKTAPATRSCRFEEVEYRYTSGSSNAYGHWRNAYEGEDSG